MEGARSLKKPFFGAEQENWGGWKKETKIFYTSKKISMPGTGQVLSTSKYNKRGAPIFFRIQIEVKIN